MSGLNICQIVIKIVLPFNFHVHVHAVGAAEKSEMCGSTSEK